MTQNTKILLGLVSGFIVGFSISKLMIHTRKEEVENEGKHEVPKKKTVNLKTVDQAPEIIQEEPLQKKGSDDFPLGLGSEGDRVKRLQIFLMRNLGWVRQPDGRFDLITQRRADKFFKVKTISQKLYQQFMLDEMVHDQRLKQAK